MQLIISRDILLQAINLIFKAADKRHTMIILANMKLVLTETQLVLTASDLEVELQATLNISKGACQQVGQTTVPANKLKDIIKLLPNGQTVKLQVIDNQCVIICGNSRFKLNTLPAEDFPLLGEPEQVTPIHISRTALTDLIDKTHFAMAIQDVRYYLTGMLFELKNNQLFTVATDAHRLAVASTMINGADDIVLEAILPRKAVLELQRLIGELKRLMPNDDNQITLNVGREFLQVILPFGEIDSAGQMQNPILVSFTARLIDGKFPDYRRAMPNSTDKQACIQQEQLVNVLRRVSILSNEKSRGVVFNFSSDSVLEIQAKNAEHDEAQEQLAISYQGEPLEIHFNVGYLLDVLNVLQGEIQFKMSHANSSVLIQQANDTQHEFIVMPIRV